MRSPTSRPGCPRSPPSSASDARGLLVGPVPVPDRPDDAAPDLDVEPEQEHHPDQVAEGARALQPQVGLEGEPEADAEDPAEREQSHDDADDPAEDRHAGVGIVVAGSLTMRVPARPGPRGRSPRRRRSPYRKRSDPRAGPGPARC